MKDNRFVQLTILGALVLMVWMTTIIFQFDSRGSLLGEFVTFSGTFSTQTIQQYYPYGEWEIAGVRYNGNPYDLEATATFTRQGGGETRTVELFYAGDTDTNIGTWKFRFNGDLVGTWDLAVSTSSPQDLDNVIDNWTGQVIVENNPNNVLKRGFVIQHPTYENKWTKSNFVITNEGYSPAFVSAASLDEYYFTPGKLTLDLNEFVYNHNLTAESSSQNNHGFDGFHIPVYCRWFDIEAEDGECDNASANAYNDYSQFNPDIRTFEALEKVITETYKRGGSVHIWLWGKSSDQNSNSGSYGGPDSSISYRLYDYIAARLGPIPGWTMGFQDDEVNVLVEDWYDYMNGPSGKLAWEHQLTATGKVDYNNSAQIDGNLGNNTDRLKAFDFSSYGLIADDTNTYSWALEQPSYNLYLNAIGAAPVSSELRPVINDARFIVGDTTDSAYFYELDGNTYLMSQRDFVYKIMAGGIAGIYTNIGDPGDTGILDGQTVSLPFTSGNYYSGTVPNSIDANRQHPGGTATPYDAKQHILNAAIVKNRYLKADMTNCTETIINGSETAGTGFSLNDGTGVCLESTTSGTELLIIYEEDYDPAGTNDQISLDLSGYTTINEVRAINLHASSYSEINISGISNSATEVIDNGDLSTAGDYMIVINVDDGSAAPDDITDLTATVADQAVVLNWTPPDDNGHLIFNYQVFFREFGQPSFGSAIDTNSSSNTFIVDTGLGLSVGTTYEFVVRAENISGVATGDSNIAIATVIEVPDAVSDLSGVQDTSSVDLSWTAPSANGGTISDYQIEYKLSTDSEYQIFIDGVSSLNASTVNNLMGAVIYDFRIAAINEAGQGAYSNVESVNMTALLPPINDLFRFYNSGTGAHFYTSSTSQRDAVINNFPQFEYEGPKSLVFNNNNLSNPDVTPVYRFYNSTTGAHFYTSSASQRDAVIANFPQFLYESISFYVFNTSYAGADSKPVYKFYNPNSGAHFYTDKESEKNTLLTDPRFDFFIYEGVAYKVPVAEV